MLLLFFHSLFIHQKSKPNPSVKLNPAKNRKMSTVEAKTKAKQEDEPTEKSPKRIFKMIYQVLKHNELQKINKHLEGDKPDYISLNSWFNFVSLEKHWHQFKDLNKSLHENSKKWIEYFQLNKPLMNLTQKDIDLLNDTPLEAELSIFDKLLLWMSVRPDKVFKIDIF